MDKALRVLPLLLLPLGAARAETFDADPSNYRDVLATLAPGDTMLLQPGDYTSGLPIQDVQGTEDSWIVVRGADGGQSRFLGRACCNTVEIRGSAYVAIENLTLDGQDIESVFAVSASGNPSHHVRIEGCTIVGHGASQATVAISTKATTWNWTIRRNTIVAAGTGMYLGNSDGTFPFIAGLIEYNLFLDAHGYNTQIKHQFSRDGSIPGIPTAPQRTVIRHNVFIKGELPNDSGARPNLLLGAFPATGLGSEDSYEVYGNLFYHNHRESLIQAEGRVSIHDNVFVDCTGNAVYLTDHNDKLRRAYVYNNTFFGVATAIRFADPATEDHRVVGNLMLSGTGIAGSFTNASDNIHDSVANAASYVRNPSLVLGEMDFYPLPGACQGSAADLSVFSGEVDYDRDFNGDAKGAFTFRGAYAGEGTNPGWLLDGAIKGEVAGGGDVTPPGGTTGGGSGGGGAAGLDLLLLAAGILLATRRAR